MDISVVLCTFNRCASLAATLESVAASKLPRSVDWEVLVVDNNSSDQTGKVADEFCRQWPNHFRYVFESRQGKSYALNAGIAEARGDAIAFVDDDVIVEPAWLQNLSAPLKEWSGTGGRTLLDRRFSPPRWLGLTEPYNLGGVLAQFDLGDRPCRLSQSPYGANMAFRKQVFRKYGGFRTDLGPRPGSSIRGEDTEFGRRLLANGERLRYEPSAVVYHPVSEDRIKKEYFLTWYFDHGRAMVREWERGPDILGIPRRCLTFFKLTGTVLPVRLLQWTFALHPQRRFFYKCWSWVTMGQSVESYRQWRSGQGADNSTQGAPGR